MLIEHFQIRNSEALEGGEKSDPFKKSLMTKSQVVRFSPVVVTEFQVYMLMLLCQFIAILIAYRYHTWSSLIFICWTLNGCFTSNLKKFGDYSKVYFPLFLLVAAWYYTINIDSLINAEVWRSK
jgi:hypothetical protein